MAKTIQGSTWLGTFIEKEMGIPPRGALSADEWEEVEEYLDDEIYCVWQEMEGDLGCRDTLEYTHWKRMKKLLGYREEVRHLIRTLKEEQ